MSKQENEDNSNNNKSTILNSIGDYAKTHFIVNWASATVIFGAITYSVIMYNQNQSLKLTIDEQTKTVNTLSSAVKTLETTVTVMQSTLDAFKANPPAVIDEKINGIYRLIQVYHPNGVNNNTPPTFTPTELPNRHPNPNITN